MTFLWSCFFPGVVQEISAPPVHPAGPPDLVHGEHPFLSSLLQDADLPPEVPPAEVTRPRGTIPKHLRD